MNRHGIHYEVLNSRKSDEGGRCWEVEVHAAPEEIQVFAESGFLVRECLFQGEALLRLQNALDKVGSEGMGKTLMRPLPESEGGGLLHAI